MFFFCVFKFNLRKNPFTYIHVCACYVRLCVSAYLCTLYMYMYILLLIKAAELSSSFNCFLEANRKHSDAASDV